MSLSPEPGGPDVAQLVVGMAEACAGDAVASGATRLRLEVQTPSLAFWHDAASAGLRATQPVELPALAPWLRWCESWSIVVRAEGSATRHAVSGRGGLVLEPWREDSMPAPGGTRLTFAWNPLVVPGDLQSPEVLFGLREVARRASSLAFDVRLPAGTRW